MKWKLVFFGLCLLSIATNAQDRENKGHAVAAHVWLGKMIKHNERFTGPIPPISTAFQIEYLKQTLGEKKWHSQRNYPIIGAGALFIHYGYPEIYGSVIGVYPLLQIPIVKSNDFEWTAQIGAGIGYVTKHYSIENNQNVAIGSHINNVSPFSTDLRWHIDPQWDVELGLSAVHVSNAAFAFPNLGINMWGVRAGARYYFAPRSPIEMAKEQETVSKKLMFSAKGSLAFVEKGFADGPKYPVYTASLWGRYQYNNVQKAILGLEYTYNNATAAFIHSLEEPVGKNGNIPYQVSGFLGNEFLFGRLGVSVQVGYYLKKYQGLNSSFYQRLGGNYYFIQKEQGLFKELFLSLHLKTHQFTAEFCDLGLGFSF